MNTDSSELRINARLTGTDARHFRELQKREGLSASDLLRDALRAYHSERLRPRAQVAKLLKASGFIGGGEGPADLSERYKDYLSESLEHKYPMRVQER
ncbi:MAG: ribbon-helix-helix protein, CopG family [Rhodanobacter sp.]|nr:ribbon-helix-helix protein, CopG family [Rhodanobacter sp.]